MADRATWPSAPPPSLTPDSRAVQVWRVILDGAPEVYEACAGTLDSDEQARAARIPFERERSRFVCARGILRRLLGSLLGCAPERVGFCYNQLGRPSLDPARHAGDLRFSLAHSGPCLVIAVARHRDVGVDLELLRSVSEAERIAANYFSPSERTTFRQAAPALRDRIFLNAWTRKEALAKARGLGLAAGFSKLEVTLAPGEAPRLIRAPWDPEGVERWTLAELDLGSEWIGVLAVEGSDFDLICWDLDARTGAPHRRSDLLNCSSVRRNAGVHAQS